MARRESSPTWRQTPRHDAAVGSKGARVCSEEENFQATEEGSTPLVIRMSLTRNSFPVAVTLESVFCHEPPSLSNLGENAPLWVFRRFRPLHILQVAHMLTTSRRTGDIYIKTGR